MLPDLDPSLRPTQAPVPNLTQEPEVELTPGQMRQEVFLRIQSAILGVGKNDPKFNYALDPDCVFLPDVICIGISYVALNASGLGKFPLVVVAPYLNDNPGLAPLAKTYENHGWQYHSLSTRSFSPQRDEHSLNLQPIFQDQLHFPDIKIAFTDAEEPGKLRTEISGNFTDLRFNPNSDSVLTLGKNNLMLVVVNPRLVTQNPYGLRMKPGSVLITKVLLPFGHEIAFDTHGHLIPDPAKPITTPGLAPAVLPPITLYSHTFDEVKSRHVGNGNRGYRHRGRKMTTGRGGHFFILDPRQ